MLVLLLLLCLLLLVAGADWPQQTELPSRPNAPPRIFNSAAKRKARRRQSAAKFRWTKQAATSEYLEEQQQQHQQVNSKFGVKVSRSMRTSDSAGKDVSGGHRRQQFFADWWGQWPGWQLVLLLLLTGISVGVVAIRPPSALSLAMTDQSIDSLAFDEVAWPPLKHHDIWNTLDATAANQLSEDGDVLAAQQADVEEGAHVDGLIDGSVEVVPGGSGWPILSSVGDERGGGGGSEEEDGTAADEGEGAAREGQTDKADELQPLEKRQRNDNADFWALATRATTSAPAEATTSNRRGKVLGLFPDPVDGECLSSDGRRTGTCFNPYECRARGGTAKGDCALGFGVCCIFVADCNVTISNNITYLVSPNFPSFMSGNFSACRIRVKLMSEEISQLRLDFQHFSLGQPNRRTGVCDGDTFSVSGGPGGAFTLCGQNSGQHLYYDVVGRSLPRQAVYASLSPLTFAQLYPPRRNTSATNGAAAASVEEPPMIELTMNFSQRFLPIRLWEIRVAQIPFSQRAPAGCLQYHSGSEGVLQTFNFAENGRHLANQRYRICMRQEAGMCSIVYEPCDEQSFRIGPPQRMMMMAGGMMGGMMGGAMGGIMGGGDMMSAAMMSTASSTAGTLNTRVSSTMATPTSAAAPSAVNMSTAASATTAAPTMATTTAATTASNATTLMMRSTTTTTTTTAAPVMNDDAPASSPAAAEPTTAAAEATTTAAATTPSTSTTPAAVLSDDVEGSGGDGSDYFNEDDDSSPPARPSITRPARPPVSGGFDLLGFLRSAFTFRDFAGSQQRSRHRTGRQFYSTCSDRITMPCIIEDFIGAGLGPLPGCEPIHCGSQFCSSGAWPCRIESTVTPFYIGVNFGSGTAKGSAEDNIGACLRYAQVQCV